MPLLEVKGDLFKNSDKNAALVHCISEDCRMGKGIAVKFKELFGGVAELKTQVANGKKTGKAAVLKRDGRLIFYLITKKIYSDKPTYESLESSLKDMKEQLENEGVKMVAMPRIGCGLDGLKWDQVSQIVKSQFEDTDISVTVYSL